MSQQYFEVQAVRRRLGPVATGEPFEVRLTAGGALAYVSLTNGGAQVAGSIVLTDPAQGSLKLWGPTDDTDTLYVRSVNDVSLGWQRITADPDTRLDTLKGRLDIVVNEGPLSIADSRVATVPADSGDHALAMQRAIDLAETAVSGNTSIPEIAVPPGLYSWETEVDWKTASIRSADPLSSVAIVWNGPAGATMLTKDPASEWPTFGEIENIHFGSDANEPAVILDLSGIVVDKFLTLRRVHFARCSGPAIKMGPWINAHWEHLRFDNIGGYAIAAAPLGSSGQFLSTFLLDGFTYDHSRSSGPASGAFSIDNSDNLSNLGTFTIRGGRIEVNTAWAGSQAVVRLKLPNSSPNPRTLGISLEDITYQDSASMVSDVLLYHDTSATTQFPSLMLKDLRQSGLSAVVGGGLSAAFPAIPLLTNYGYVAVNQGDYDAVVNSIQTQVEHLLPIVAPAAPSSGARVYVDVADSKAKLIKAGGDIIVLG